jgi:uncharacterized membrane protein
MIRTMNVNASGAGLVVATFLASAVELVEAFTIVLAMGLTRGWRSTLWGVAAALGALSVATAIGGYALATWFPASALQLGIGTLLLIFGLQWLRKAILRASGLKALHDEEAIFREEQEAARRAGSEERLGLDWFAFTVSFKGVFLEGLEVVFIVITFGLNANSIPLASAGAVAAAALVLGVGAVAHRPLAQVPENTIKMVVGLLLSTFGTFWASEGLGVFTPSRQPLAWPGGDLALLVVLAAWSLLTYGSITLLRRATASRPSAAEAAS